MFRTELTLSYNVIKIYILVSLYPKKLFEYILIY